MLSLFRTEKTDDHIRKEHAVMLAALKIIAKACKPGAFNVDGVDFGKVAADAIPPDK